MPIKTVPHIDTLSVSFTRLFLRWTNVLQEKNYIAIRNSQINYYKNVGLYYIESGSFVLYKPPGKLMADLRMKEGRHPTELSTFIKMIGK